MTTTAGWREPTAEPAVRIRNRTAQDADRIAELARESIETHLRRFPDLRPAPDLTWLRDELLAYPAGPDGYLRVAECEGQVVGFLSATVDDAPQGGLERFDGPRVYLSDVAVTADHRDRGIGRLLMTDLERWARERGAVAITLNTFHGNPAARLYQELGYHPTWQTYRKNL